MTTRKPQPTNADIMREIKDVKSMQGSQAKDISELKNWRSGLAIAEAAVDKYKSKEAQGDKRKLIRDISAFLAVLTLLIWAIIQFLGTHK